MGQKGRLSRGRKAAEPETAEGEGEAASAERWRAKAAEIRCGYDLRLRATTGMVRPAFAW